MAEGDEGEVVGAEEGVIFVAGMVGDEVLEGRGMVLFGGLRSGGGWDWALTRKR